MGLILLCLFRRWFLLRIQRKGKEKRKGFLSHPSCGISCCSAGRPGYNCYQLALVWLSVFEGTALLPTKTHTHTHTSLGVTGTSLGTRKGTQHDDTTHSNYGIYKKLHSLGKFSFNFFLFLLALDCFLYTNPEGLWWVRNVAFTCF